MSASPESGPSFEDLIENVKQFYPEKAAQLKQHYDKIEASKDQILKGRLEEVPMRVVDLVDIKIFPRDMFNERGKLLHQKVVEEIRAQAPKDYLITPINEKGGDVIFKYDEKIGIYRPDGNPWLESLIKDIFGEEVKTGDITQILRLMQISTYSFDPDYFTEDKDHIIVENGALNIYTKELSPFSPDYHSLSRIPVEYEKEAKCPKIIKFLNEIAPESVNLLQEWVGYHLLKDYRFQKSFMLIGSGANGKTTFLKLIEAFLGKENVSHESLYELCSNRFSSAELYGKLANIAPDISKDELTRTGKFKALTGGDRIRGEKKHQNAFYYWNYAKLSFSCNQLPTTPDMSYAFFRRWIPLIFKQVFEGENANPLILDELTAPEERSGLLNWALEGLDKILEKGDFTTSPSALEIQELWEEMQEPVQAFFKNCLVDDPEGMVTKDDMMSAHVGFCRAFGHVSLSKNKLTEKLKPAFPRMVGARPKIRGERINVWKGINVFCGLNKVSCQGCQGCQGSSFLDNVEMQQILDKRYNDPDMPDNPDPERPQNLQNSIDEFLRFLDNKIKIVGEEVIEKNWFCQELVEEGWEPAGPEKICDLLMRDGILFMPRPGYLKRCT